ncbi:MAG TPA: hypothetical protein VLZ74_09570 [Methylocella sp.]|nr:hypothetical protein [Methylocella sp.]
MNEDAIKAEVRLYALESLVCQLYAMIYALTGKPREALQNRRETLIGKARLKGFSGLDPAMSDFASAELESAIDRLLKMQEEILGKG